MPLRKSSFKTSVSPGELPGTITKRLLIPSQKYSPTESCTTSDDANSSVFDNNSPIKPLLSTFQYTPPNQEHRLRVFFFQRPMLSKLDRVMPGVLWKLGELFPIMPNDPSAYNSSDPTFSR
ncbi:hypothetical protein P167DRAFT_579644 [Morchella conica CCBAS932]|uniref:Uncharacterized protein n=1 Tax=Morchella conica CCBAS932 TaxID=1392247 RepID=A0A3N4K997_9PEZI|nr:hypothetical protein P167DRAFT_579644 [Morchella conica CCBAS932]